MYLHKQASLNGNLLSLSHLVRPFLSIHLPQPAPNLDEMRKDTLRSLRPDYIVFDFPYVNDYQCLHRNERLDNREHVATPVR